MSKRKDPAESSTVAQKTRVFLSHSWGGSKKQQHEFTARIWNLLTKEKDLDPILDEEYFSPGLSWKEVFKEVLSGGRAVVILQFSREFLLSASCTYELEEARNAFLIRGVPLIAIRIDDCTLPTFLKDDIHVDMKKTYELFVDNQVDLESEFKSKIKVLTRGIRDRIREYEQTVHLTRVIRPNDPAFDESKALYVQYPGDYRDEPESIQQWLAECSDTEYPNQYFEELYYVAYYHGKCVGVLYATHYRSTKHNKGYCVIKTLIVAEEREVCAGKIVARELLHKLRRETNIECHCERFLVEIPWLRHLESSERDACLRSWQSLENDEKLAIFQGLKYLCPDASDFLADRDDYKEVQMHLLSVFGYPRLRMKKKQVERELLDFIYGVYHAECYVVPFILREWVKLVDKLQQQVADELPDELRVVPIEPTNIIKALENDELNAEQT